MPQKVSVIVPAFNCENFVDKAINSILNQTYDDMEIIIIDDGSTDDTYGRIKHLSSIHRQIIVCENNRSKGPAGARNTGLDKASGEYIAFLDADDIWLPNHLKLGIGFLENKKEIDSIFFNFDIIDSENDLILGDWFSKRRFPCGLNSEELETDYYLITGDVFRALINESFIHLQSLILRKKPVNGIYFDEHLFFAEDRDFSIRLAIEANIKFSYSKIKTGIYYRNENSITSENSIYSEKLYDSHIYLFSTYIRKYDIDKEVKNEIHQLIYKSYLGKSYANRKNNIYLISFVNIIKSLKYDRSVNQVIELLKIIYETIQYYLTKGNRRQRSQIFF